MSDENLRDKLASDFKYMSLAISEMERERDRLKAQCEKLVEALESVVPGLQELSKILKDNALDEKQGIAEHDACLIACGFLKGNIQQALAEYRKQFPKDKE